MLLLTMLALAVPSSADAATPGWSLNAVNPQYAKWAARSMVALPGVAVTVEDQRCASASACTAPGEPVYIDPTLPAKDRRQMFFHELGHQRDYVNMTEARRDEFMAEIGFTGAWRDPALLHWSAHELFAETYAVCAQSQRDSRGRWRYPDQQSLTVSPDSTRPVTNRRMAIICGLIDAIDL